MGKLLAEVIEEQLRTVRQDSQWRIVAHRGDRLGTVGTHRHNDALNVFTAVTECPQSLVVFVDGVGDTATGLQFVQFHAVVGQPRAVGLCVGKLFLQLPIVVYFTFFRIDQ